jgi:predicted nuclease of restriction endonuclease-like (RecB) superfamily
MKKITKNLIVTKDLVSVNEIVERLYQKVSPHIDHARNQVKRSIDTEMVTAYWLIGRDIVEEEQNGEDRARYGISLLLGLSKKLTEQHGRGFSSENLQRMRQFYLVYKDAPPIQYALRTESKLSQNLGWIHYRALMRISRVDARKFYEIEAERNNWSGRELERQIGSLLFDRLAKSKNKEQFLQLACEGHEIAKPEDTIKDPVVLEFLNIPESHKLVESKLEQALINNLQNFMLELGKGFAFVGRQKRITFDSNHYYCDLVFYSIPLKAYIIIDIKTRPLSHADLGQIQLYVNYFDKELKMDNDNPTIGLVLCTEKSNKMVEYFLGNNPKQIFASTYQFNLPTVEQLEAELKREIEEFKRLEKSDTVEEL